MDEQKITQRLQDNIAKAGVDTTSGATIISDPKPEETPTIEAMHNNLPLDNMVLEQNIMNLLDIPNTQRFSAETKDKVAKITRWASENSRSNEMSDILDTIHTQMRMMGAIGRDDKVDRLYKYVRLSMVRSGIETQMKALYE